MFRIINVNPERCSILHEICGVDNALYAIMQEITMQDKRIALITGANQGIGLQVAKELVAHGLTVLVGSRDFEKGQAAAKQLGPDAHAIQIDVTDHASITAAAERIRTEFGRLDVLVNNAAISHTGRRAGMTIEEYA
jgi:NAD(P)-dependent dehydrogenase (short-subunit alcohol dehydrogenase family)